MANKPVESLCQFITIAHRIMRQFRERLRPRKLLHGKQARTHTIVHCVFRPAPVHAACSANATSRLPGRADRLNHAVAHQLVPRSRMERMDQHGEHLHHSAVVDTVLRTRRTHHRARRVTDVLLGAKRCVRFSLLRHFPIPYLHQRQLFGKRRVSIRQLFSRCAGLLRVERKHDSARRLRHRQSHLHRIVRTTMPDTNAYL